MGQELEGVVRLSAEGLEQRGLKEGALFLFHARRQPAQAAEHVEHAAEVGGGIFHFPEQGRGLPHLGHVGIGEQFDVLHPLSGCLSAGNGGLNEKSAHANQLINGLRHA